jgi:DNA-binding FadR family transcriptional regulator
MFGAFSDITNTSIKELKAQFEEIEPIRKDILDLVREQKNFHRALAQKANSNAFEILVDRCKDLATNAALKLTND